MSSTAPDAAGTSFAGVHVLVARQVAARPHACAVRDVLGRELSYARLWERSGEVASTLTRHGVGPGARVVVALERSADLVAVLLGVLRTGAAYVPVDPHAPGARREAVVRDCDADAVVTAGASGSGPSGQRVPRLTPGDLFDRAEPGQDAPPVQAPEPVHDVPPVEDAAPVRFVAPGDAAFIGYTSGSTGRPKGVVLSHSAIAHFIAGGGYCPVGPGDRVAHVASPAFDPVTFEVWNTLASGATVVVLPAVAEVPLEEWTDNLARHRIDVMFLTTALVDLVHRTAPGAFAPLRVLLFGGEAVDPEMVRGLCAVRPPGQVLHVYGPTEATTFTSSFRCDAGNLDGLDRIPIGFPLPHTTVAVLGPDLAPVPPGEPGELCIGGPRLATGYLGQPGLTEERFVLLPDGERVYRSGDLVRRRADGALEFLGRRDRQVKLRGFRIEPEEVERALLATGLLDAAVVEKAGEGPDARLVGFVVPAGRTAGPAGPLPQALARELRRHVPHYMVPTTWHVAAALPVTANGKVDRAALLARLRDPDQAVGAPH
ncbi:amino acid adenylation domain-containing protein [Kitasatospora sp. NPDC001547]|uniref:amino acid adenylation domain-containing protein n=1 Tax=Kitasatospora sp. NPDC001547 TaxID=3364015 RepID=UPI003678022C